MVIAIIVAILLITAALACYGAYILVHSSNREKEGTSKIAVSGKYAVALRPIADVLAEKKPSVADIEEWLVSQGIGGEQKNKYLKSWQSSLSNTIKTIDDGDANGVTAYRVEVGAKDSEVCRFLPQDNFITRLQINKYAELLPPYCLGSDSVIVPKLPWDNSDGTAGWQSVMPKNGAYDVPNWKIMWPVM